LLSAKVAATEREIIEEALQASQARIFGPSGAAARLGIARSMLESKIRALNINKNRFKHPLGNLRPHRRITSSAAHPH
jgi:DNA-binding NtrC family response regulator